MRGGLENGRMSWQGRILLNNFLSQNTVSVCVCVLVGVEESSCTCLPYPPSDLGAEKSSVLDWGLGNLAEMPLYSARILWSLLGGQEAVSLLFASLYCILAPITDRYTFFVFPTYSHQSRKGSVGSVQHKAILQNLEKGEKMSRITNHQRQKENSLGTACRCSSKHLRYLGEMHTCMQAPTCMKGDSIPH